MYSKISELWMDYCNFLHLKATFTLHHPKENWEHSEQEEAKTLRSIHKVLTDKAMQIPSDGKLRNSLIFSNSWWKHLGFGLQ